MLLTFSGNRTQIKRGKIRTHHNRAGKALQNNVPPHQFYTLKTGTAAYTNCLDFPLACVQSHTHYQRVARISGKKFRKKKFLFLQFGSHGRLTPAALQSRRPFLQVCSTHTNPRRSFSVSFRPYKLSWRLFQVDHPKNSGRRLRSKANYSWKLSSLVGFSIAKNTLK